MGLMSKLKNILFEEEEVEIPIIEKKEKKEPIKMEELPRKEEEKPSYSSFYDDLEPIEKNEPKKEEKVNHEPIVSEREIFKSEKTFDFPSFDEEEFESSIPKRTTNVMDLERKKKEAKVDPRRYEPKMELKKEEKPKFKPSPIISPVYGILDKNYTPDEITSRSTTPTKSLDVDSVRKKAFGITEENDEIVEEIVKTVDNEEDVLKEKMEKARTIDELLNDSSDEIISVSDIIEDSYDEPSDEIINNDEEPVLADDLADDIEEKEEVITNDELDEIDNEDVIGASDLEDDFAPAEEELNTPIEEEKEASQDLEHNDQVEEKEDALESDLFDLIDSMYENREEGE